MLSALALKEHTLNRIGYGQSVWNADRYDQLGFAAYVAEQIDRSLAPITIDGVFVEPKVERSVLERRQLEAVLLDFWYNHFNVASGNDNPPSRTSNPRGRHLPEYQNSVIGEHTLGPFLDLLMGTAKSTPMLSYLNNNVNRKPEVLADGRVVGYNQNYARELMELHTLGVDGGYDENDVQEVARILTGWRYTGVNQDPSEVFIFTTSRHDYGAKTVMDVDYPGVGIEEGENLIAFLAAHPSTADFLSKKLCIRFVGDQPPQSAIDNAATTFGDTDGDLAAVMATILNGPEFAQPDQAQFRSKVKPPHRFVASALMAMGATQASDWSAIALTLRNLIISAGDTPYYFPPPTGYPEAPGFWIGTSSMLRRFTMAERIAYDETLRDRIKSRAGATGNDILLDFDAIAAVMIPGGVSTSTADAVKDHAFAAAMTNNQRISAICHMLLSSPEFLRY